MPMVKIEDTKKNLNSEFNTIYLTHITLQYFELLDCKNTKATCVNILDIFFVGHLCRN